MNSKNKPNKFLVTFITVLIVIGGLYWLQSGTDESSAPVLADCSSLDDSWAIFQSTESSLSFCYKAAWGAPIIKETSSSPKIRSGTLCIMLAFRLMIIHILVMQLQIIR